MVTVRNKRRNTPAAPKPKSTPRKPAAVRKPKDENEEPGPNDVQRKVKLVTEQKKMYVPTIIPNPLPPC